MAYGTVDGSVGPKTGNWEAKPGVDQCVLIDVGGVFGTAEFFTGGYCRRAAEQGLLSPEGWGLEDAGEDEAEGGGGSGYGEGPPTGADEISKLFDGKKWGVRVRLWAKGQTLAVKVGDDFRVFDFTNGDMVGVVDAIIKYITQKAWLPIRWGGGL